MDRRTSRLNDELSMDMEIFVLITNELKLCTLHELQTVYNTEDAFDLLEVIEADRELREIAEIKSRQQQDANRGA